MTYPYEPTRAKIAEVAEALAINSYMSSAKHKLFIGPEIASGADRYIRFVAGGASGGLLQYAVLDFGVLGSEARRVLFAKYLECLASKNYTFDSVTVFGSDLTFAKAMHAAWPGPLAERLFERAKWQHEKSEFEVRWAASRIARAGQAA